MSPSPAARVTLTVTGAEGARASATVKVPVLPSATVMVGVETTRAWSLLSVARTTTDSDGRPVLVAVKVAASSRESASAAAEKVIGLGTFQSLGPKVSNAPADTERSASPAVRATATVTGPSGEEIHVDDLGSVKVRFPWDRSGIGDDGSSRWVRTMQMNMNGAMLLPRVGWEAPIAYFEGDPDRPLCLGRLYNGGAPVPYGQPGKKATTTFQSATSPGGAGTHELRFSDDAGSMEAFIHATKDQSVQVGGTNKVTVSANETHDVKKSTVLTITGSQTTSIAASQKITVGGDDGLSVKGARSESIGAVEDIGVTGSLNLICKGAYTEMIGGLYALECNQSTTTVQGSYTQTVGGPMVVTAGLGTNNTVAAARLEDVGGSRSFTSSNAYADSVTGVKKVTAGASSDDAGTVVATNVKGLGSVSAGASANVKAGGNIVVQGASISVKVGGTLKVKAGGELTVAGNVKVGGGTAKFDAGKTTKKQKNKVG